MRLCKICRVAKADTEFYANPNRLDKLDPRCKRCCNAASVNNRNARRDKQRFANTRLFARSAEEYIETHSIPEPNSGCWLWLGPYNNHGYGVAYRPGIHTSAHRFSWTILVGPIPEDLFVLHRCDVRECVNPRHLFLGTHDDNMADMSAKGRGHQPDLSKRGRDAAGRLVPLEAIGQMAEVRR